MAARLLFDAHVSAPLSFQRDRLKHGILSSFSEMLYFPFPLDADAAFSAGHAGAPIPRYFISAFHDDERRRRWRVFSLRQRR